MHGYATIGSFLFAMTRTPTTANDPALAFLADVSARYDQTDADAETNEIPLSGADFVEELGQLMSGQYRKLFEQHDLLPQSLRATGFEPATF